MEKTKKEEPTDFGPDNEFRVKRVNGNVYEIYKDGYFNHEEHCNNYNFLIGSAI